MHIVVLCVCARTRAHMHKCTRVVCQYTSLAELFIMNDL